MLLAESHKTHIPVNDPLVPKIMNLAKMRNPQGGRVYTYGEIVSLLDLGKYGYDTKAVSNLCISNGLRIYEPRKRRSGKRYPKSREELVAKIMAMQDRLKEMDQEIKITIDKDDNSILITNIKGCSISRITRRLRQSLEGWA